MVKTSGLDHVVLHVSDAEPTKEFYTEILGTSEYQEDNEQVFLLAGQLSLGFFKKRGEILLTGGSGSNQLMLTVATGNYTTRKAGLEAQGGRRAAARERTIASTFSTPAHRLQLILSA
jgi:catechol 2,3-dioxygenase-like lactoylglutathione lyase family enzyme